MGPDSMPREFVSRTSLPGNQLAACAARKFVRAALAEWTTQDVWPADGVSDRVVDDAVLLVSELVTNAVIHAGTTAEVLCRLRTCTRSRAYRRAGWSSRSPTTTRRG